MSRPRKARPRPRPVQSGRRGRDEDDEEDEYGSGFDLLATPRTPYSARTPQTPKSARRQGSIFGAPVRGRKSFDSLSDDESVDSYRSPPPRRRRDSFERNTRTPRMRRGLERMSRFFAPGHFPPRFDEGDPGGWPGQGRGPQEKDPVQEQIDQATMRLSMYRALCVLGSGLSGLFLILAYVLGGLVVATLPPYSQDGTQNPSTKVIIKARDNNYVPGSTMADLSSGIWGKMVIYISLAAGIFSLLCAVFQIFSEKIRKASFESLRNFMSGFSDLEDEALPPASAMWKKYGTWNCKLWFLFAFSLPTVAAVVAYLLVYFDQRGSLKSSLNGAGEIDFGQSSIFTMVATGLMLTGAGLNVLRQHLLVWLLEFRQQNGLMIAAPPPYGLPQNPAESPAYQMKTAPSPSPYGHSRNPSAFSQGSGYPTGSAFTLQRTPSTPHRTPAGALQRNPSAFSQQSKGTYAAGSGYTINSRNNPSAFTAGSYPNGSAFTIQSKRSQRSQRSKDLPWGPAQSESGIV